MRPQLGVMSRTASTVRWSTRTMLGLLLASAELGAAFLLVAVMPDPERGSPAWWMVAFPWVAHTLLVVVVPLVAFASVRLFRADARNCSWLFPLPMGVIHLVISIIFTYCAAEIETRDPFPLWVWQFVRFAAAFVAGVGGSFIRPMWATPEQKMGAPRE